MSYNLLKSFHSVCMTGSISKAADHLNVTQPAVSIALRKLQKLHGVSLLTRNGPKIKLTQDGEALQLLVSRMFDAENMVTNFLQSGENLETGLLKIASDGPLLPLKLLTLFRHNHPGVALDIRFGNNLECWNALIRREVDIALIAKSGIPNQANDHVRMYHIRKSGVSAVLPDNHPLTKNKSLHLKELLSQPLLFRETGSNTQKLLDTTLAKLGHKVDPVAVLSSREAIINAVAMGLGIGFSLDDEAIGYRNIDSIPLAELRDISDDVVVTLPASVKRKIVHTAFNYAKLLSAN